MGKAEGMVGKGEVSVRAGFGKIMRTNVKLFTFQNNVKRFKRS